MVLTSEDIFLGIVAWPTGSAGQVSAVVRGYASLGKKILCYKSRMFCTFAYTLNHYLQIWVFHKTLYYVKLE